VAARVTFAFRRTTFGRHVGSSCVPSTTGNASGPRCTRSQPTGTLGVQARAGASALRFEGRISTRARLGAGRYEVSVYATNGQGKASVARTLRFEVISAR
jgi:hypothetical protein